MRPAPDPVVPATVADLIQLCDSPVRLGILAALARRQQNSDELAQVMRVEVTVVARQLRRLRRAGVVQASTQQPSGRYTLGRTVEVDCQGTRVEITVRALDRSSVTVRFS